MSDAIVPIVVANVVGVLVVGGLFVASRNKHDNDYIASSLSNAPPVTSSITRRQPFAEGLSQQPQPHSLHIVPGSAQQPHSPSMAPGSAPQPQLQPHVPPLAPGSAQQPQPHSPPLAPGSAQQHASNVDIDKESFIRDFEKFRGMIENYDFGNIAETATRIFLDPYIVIEQGHLDSFKSTSQELIRRDLLKDESPDYYKVSLENYKDKLNELIQKYVDVNKSHDQLEIDDDEKLVTTQALISSLAARSHLLTVYLLLMKPGVEGRPGTVEENLIRLALEKNNPHYLTSYEEVYNLAPKHLGIPPMHFDHWLTVFDDLLKVLVQDKFKGEVEVELQQATKEELKLYNSYTTDFTNIENGEAAIPYKQQTLFVNDANTQEYASILVDIIKGQDENEFDYVQAFSEWVRHHGESEKNREESSAELQDVIGMLGKLDYDIKYYNIEEIYLYQQTTSEKKLTSKVETQHVNNIPISPDMKNYFTRFMQVMMKVLLLYYTDFIETQNRNLEEFVERVEVDDGWLTLSMYFNNDFRYRLNSIDENFILFQKNGGEGKLLGSDIKHELPIELVPPEEPINWAMLLERWFHWLHLLILKYRQVR